MSISNQAARTEENDHDQSFNSYNEMGGDTESHISCDCGDNTFNNKLGECIHNNNNKYNYPSGDDNFSPIEY